MMYQACSKPGTKPRPGIYVSGFTIVDTLGEVNVQHRAILIKLSALHIPRLTQTASGGKRMAIKPRKMSLPHISVW